MDRVLRRRKIHMLNEENVKRLFATVEAQTKLLEHLIKAHNTIAERQVKLSEHAILMADRLIKLEKNKA